MKTFRGKLIFAKLMKKVMGGMKTSKKGNKKDGAMGFEIQKEDMMHMLNGFSVLRLVTMIGGFVSVEFTKEELLDLNKKLNKIKAPKK